MSLDRRGSVLVHVLMTGVVVAIIAAGLMRLTLLRYAAGARAASATVARRQADGALNRAISYWNETNTVCADFSTYDCSGTPGICGCICTGAAGEPRIEATLITPPPPPDQPDCKIDIQTADPLP